MVDATKCMMQSKIVLLIPPVTLVVRPGRPTLTTLLANSNCIFFKKNIIPSNLSKSIEIRKTPSKSVKNQSKSDEVGQSQSTSVKNPLRIPHNPSQSVEIRQESIEIRNLSKSVNIHRILSISVKILQNPIRIREICQESIEIQIQIRAHTVFSYYQHVTSHKKIRMIPRLVIEKIDKTN